MLHNKFGFKFCFLIFLIDAVSLSRVSESQRIIGKQYFPKSNPKELDASKGSSLINSHVDSKSAGKIITTLLKCVKQIDLLASSKYMDKEKELAKFLDLQDELFVQISKDQSTTEYAFDLFEKLASKALRKNPYFKH